MKPEVEKAIRQAEDPEAVMLLDEEMERLEALLAQAEPNGPQWSQVAQALTVAYQQGARMIAAAARAMKYPKNPWEWDDSAPIDAVARLHPAIEGTDWHQRMLGQIMLAPSKPHPWYTLPTAP